MSGTLRIIAGTRIYVRPPDAPPLASERDVGDLIGETYGLEADWVAVPVAQLALDFFRLTSGLAGAIVQKLVTYGLKAAFIGDVSAHAAASEALSAFIAESNRGRQVWFVDDMAEFERRLSATPPSPSPPAHN
jgi:hypothetical protein